jgi:hypothetical protein
VLLSNEYLSSLEDRQISIPVYNIGIRTMGFHASNNLDDKAEKGVVVISKIGLAKLFCNKNLAGLSHRVLIPIPSSD